MKNEKQLREQIGELSREIESLTTLAKSENRDFAEDEQATFDSKLADLDTRQTELDKVIKQNEILKKAASLAGSSVEVKPEVKEERKMAEQMSFGKMLRAAADPSLLDGVERELHQEGKKDMASIGKSSRGVVIPHSVLNRAVITENGTSGIETQNFIDAMYANTILDSLGVTKITTSSDQRIPVMGAVSTQWEGETDNAADGGSALSKIDFAPRRLATYVDYSKLASLQHNESIENALRRNIAKAVGAKLEYAVFTDDSSNGAFNPIFTGKTAVDNADITALILALQEEVLENNYKQGNTLGFAASSALWSDLHTAAQVSGVNPLVLGGRVMGEQLEFSTQIANISTKPVIYYGDWSYYQMVQFGGIEILLDPYTQAIGGKDRLVLNSYWDAGLTVDEAISVGTKASS